MCDGSAFLSGPISPQIKGAFWNEAISLVDLGDDVFQCVRVGALASAAFHVFGASARSENADDDSDGSRIDYHLDAEHVVQRLETFAGRASCGGDGDAVQTGSFAGWEDDRRGVLGDAAGAG